MGGAISIKDLGAWVDDLDARGGVDHPDFNVWTRDFTLNIGQAVDESLDPFSDAYVDQMIGLYRTMAGRDLDQATGELTYLDVDAHVAGQNPYNSPDIDRIARHAKAIAATLQLAAPPHAARVLDMGSGWGLTSEIIAYCGGRVTSVDINPDFAALVRRRAERLNLPIETRVSEFDAFSDDGEPYDLAMFYECLHHAVRPWETLKRIGAYLGPQGKFAFAGEPINGRWWKHWGLQLHPVAVYCIRKFGWFESGWSDDFLARSFRYAGFDLTLHAGAGLDGGPVGIAVRSAQPFAGPVSYAQLAPAAPLYWRPAPKLKKQKTLAQRARQLLHIR